MALQPGVLRAIGSYELWLQRWKRIDPRLKALAGLKAAALVGCPW
jgi:hypothetical protein